MKKYSLAFALAALVWMSHPCLASQTERKESPSIAPVATSLETVRKAYIEGKDKDVLILVERALIETSSIGDIEGKAAELYFWKGSALRRLGRFDEAVIALDHAKSLGYGAPELYFERGLTEKSLGNTQESQDDYREAQRRLPSDPEARDLYLKHWKWDAAEQPRFQLWLAPQAGWDSNVVGLDKDTPLEQGKVHFDSYYAGAYVDAKFFFVQNQHQLLWIEEQLMGREYPQEESVSFLDNILTLAGRQPLLENVDLELRASYEEAFVKDTGHFRTQRSLGPAFLIQPLRDVQMRLWGDWTDASYYESVPDEQKRSGTLVRIGTSIAIDVGRGWSAGPFGTWNKANTDGTDYDAHGWELGFQATSPEFAGFKVLAVLSYGEEDYASLNSLSGFTKKRLDHVLGGSVTLTFKQIEKWLGYAPTISVGYVHHASNITEFDYSRWTPQIELSLGVLSF
jgi:tetratricopeptide (TPR) repeat protein